MKSKSPEWMGTLCPKHVAVKRWPGHSCRLVFRVFRQIDDKEGFWTVL
jgi:hypothetical protein